MSGLPLRAPYTFAAVRDIMARCPGALILAFARWRDPAGDDRIVMPTVWNHFEGAFALALKKKILVITEDNVATDGITWDGGAQIILRAPREARPDWLETAYAKPKFDAWMDAVKGMKDVFARLQQQGTGDCQRHHQVPGRSRGVGPRLGNPRTGLDDFGRVGRGFKKLSWSDHASHEGRRIPERREFRRTSRQRHLRMGLFMEAKGRERELVVREEGARMPADIGGGIYLQLRDRNDITPIQMKLLDFIEKRI